MVRKPRPPNVGFGSPVSFRCKSVYRSMRRSKWSVQLRWATRAGRRAYTLSKSKGVTKVCAKRCLKFDANGSLAQRTPGCYGWRMTCGGRGISVLFNLVPTKCSEQCSPKPQDSLALERRIEIQFYRKLTVTSYSLVFRCSLRALSRKKLTDSRYV